MLAACERSLHRCIDQVELEALQQGLKKATRHVYFNIEAKIDSTMAMVVSYFNLDIPPWEVSKTAKQVKQDIMKLRSFSLKHIYSETSWLEDKLGFV